MSNSTLELRVRAVAAVQAGLSVAGVARAYQLHRATVYRWVERAKQPDGLARGAVSGRPRKVLAADAAKLSEIVMQPATNFGYETDVWTCGRLVQVIKTTLKINVSKMTIARRLKAAGLSYQKPERTYMEASAPLRAAWTAKVLPRIKRTVKKHKAVLYFEDEALISLTAVVGKTWAPRGQTPKVAVTGRRGGVAAMSAISKGGRLVFRVLDKRINADDVIGFLEQLLKHHARRHLVVVMDRAPPHTAKKTQAFIKAQRRLHVFYLPAYSPDWNPDEKVWNHLKHQELKSHQARTTKELKSLTRRKLAKMAKNPSQLRGIFFRCCVAELL